MKNPMKKTVGQWGWLVLVAGCGGDPLRAADVGTTSDVDVARSDSGDVVDATLMDTPSLDAASGDTAVVDAGSTSDATTVDTGSVIDSAVADMGTPVVCGSGTHLCGSSCVSDTAVTSCGSSCTACAVPTGGSATCSGGVCGQSCPSGMTLCGGACIALTTTANCGACGVACSSGQTCRGGTCVSSTGTCPAGMAYIPAGSFRMGDDSEMYAQVPHMVTLSAYCMDLTEVTVSAYRLCTAIGCSTPTTGNYYNWGVAARDNHPINGVDWFQSRAYCQWRGGDLPTEAQWEYAARGSDVANHMYPWGNAAPGLQLCWGPTSPSGTCPVRTYPSGNSPFGLFDMAGNVGERTLDFFAYYERTPVTDPTGPTSGSEHVIRGGSWVSPRVHAAARDSLTQLFRDNTIGFRCSRGAI